MLEQRYCVRRQIETVRVAACIHDQIVKIGRQQRAQVGAPVADGAQRVSIAEVVAIYGESEAGLKSSQSIDLRSQLASTR